jgi:integration host factor subunit alpha
VGLGKKDIIKNIYSKTQLSSKDSRKVLDFFINYLVNNKNIKLSNFGSFTLVNTPKRIGRNPKTKEEFLIKAREKISFKASKKIKSFLN